MRATFAAGEALDMIQFLASDELAGRLAGSSGAETAASTIADGFRAAGLQPAGDDGTFFQTVPITLSRIIDAPRLAIVTSAGETVPLIYRDEFLAVHPTMGGEPVSGNLFYVQKEADYGAVDFEGGIVVRNPTMTLSEEIQLAQDHGAGALILTGFKRDDNDLYGKQPVSLLQTAAVPVLELTPNGHMRLLSLFDIESLQVKNLLPVQPLDGTAEINYAVTPPHETTTSNVLAFLPGSDPFLSQEIIIAGAHYDYVGDDEDGRRYGGANDASGAATLLEIAKMWQETGYRPQRSILFAAWGAQEMGNLGSEYYAANPTRPFTDTIALIQLEGVGGGDGFALGAEGDEDRDGFLLGSLETAVSLLDEKLIITPNTTSSDISSFAGQGFPTMLISWRLAGNANLSDETAVPVKAENLQLSGQAAALLLMSLAQ